MIQRPTRRRLFKHLKALGIALGGTLFVLSSVSLMNKFVTFEQGDKTGPQVNFSVPQLAPRPLTPPPPQQKRTPPKNNRNLAPLPSLGSGLSSITLYSPDYASGDLGGLNENLLGDLDAVAMTAETVDKPPVVKVGALPYPERAKQMKQEGRVVVSVLIGADGRVKNHKILESTPSGVFDQAVKDSLPNWVFTPAEYQGRAVQIWATLPLDFTLN